MANTEFPKSISNTPVEDHSFDWKLFLTVAWITRWWIVIYFLTVLLFAYLYIRYATPVYESQADVQFKDRSKDNSIDLGILVSSPNADRLNEEMTVLESKGYKLQALKTLPINISYFLSERVKSGQIYKASPFNVTAEIIDSAIIGTKIDFQIKNEKSYSITYDYDG